VATEVAGVAVAGVVTLGFVPLPGSTTNYVPDQIMLPSLYLGLSMMAGLIALI
jgi:hypothetical protein